MIYRNFNIFYLTFDIYYLNGEFLRLNLYSIISAFQCSRITTPYFEKP